MSHEEGQQIVTAALLMNDLPGGRVNLHDPNKAYRDLRHLLEKDTRLHLNSAQLSSYRRKGLIPRGPRIKTFPAY